ncbi:MAG TPA: DNA polymerase Y family protein [Casimicrobiaceae bacterium]|nr:DNA polymerase Y family protein [Casimicrobiaceae bacterium]
MLFLALHFPSLALDVYARAWSSEQHERPFVVASGGHYPRVVAANVAARRAGIRRDQLISAALALAPELAMRDRDPVAETAALAEIATCALAFTPNASIAAPCAVIAEIGASIKLFGGLARLTAALRARIATQGYAVRCAVAPTPLGAQLLARANLGTPIERLRDLRATLEPLPLKLLDWDAGMLETLHSAGIETLGQVVRLPREGMARRFGTGIVDTLDRALGRIPDPRPAYLPPPRFERNLTLPAPVEDTQALGFAANRLVHDLCAWLHARGLGTTRLSLSLIHERYVRERGTSATEVPFALAGASRTPAHLNGVLRERLERVALPAPVESIALRTEATAPLAGRNLGLLPEDEASRSDVPLIDRLRARLGDAAVALLASVAEHRPELAGVVKDERPTGADAHVDTTQRARAASRRKSPPAPAPLPVAPRPVWMLSEPQPLAQWLQARPWILRDGPERIESGWWDGRDYKRDYFVAETPEGEVMWIYRDHRYGTDDGEWFLHGVFS